jgi:broad specificity phosphatase PhoE
MNAAVRWRTLLLLTCFGMCVSASSDSSTSSTKVRFYLIRHGESEANSQGIYAGQSDSLLTDGGKKEAQALGRTAFLRETPFWRLYSSDLSRAHNTALFALQEARRDDVSTVY